MKILIIIPHCSTGGMPQVALKRVESLIGKHELYVIEYRQIATQYVVQRNKIKELLGDEFISLGGNDNETERDRFEEIIENINPDIIHMEEIPEMFIFGMRKEHSDWLYKEDRPYKIIETTHTSTFDISSKVYKPDSFMFVSEFSKKQYESFGIPSSVVEYPSEKKEKNKIQSLVEIGLDYDYFNILNVGLFTQGKNQSYLIDIAERLLEYRIKFHFVGNMAENFSDYWKPILERENTNCVFHGERDDVEKFYQATDLLIHPSTLELNPLVIKEATSYELPVYLNHLPTYGDMYDKYKNVKHLTMDLDQDVKMILDSFNIMRNDDNITYYDELSNEYLALLDTKNDDKYTNDNIPEIGSNLEEIKYNVSFVDGARVEMLSNMDLKFNIDISDKNTEEMLYNTTLSKNEWCTTNTKYFREYKVDIKYDDKIVVSHNFDLKGENVLIQLDSKSIGDTIAWFPYVEEFRQKHDCNVYCVTFWNYWFSKEYPEIKFLEPGFKDDIELYARYLIGWYRPIDPDRNPIDYRTIPLQQTASDILGLDYKEVRPRIHVADGVRPIEEKYVCIAQFSTANTKHWHYPHKDSNKGWQTIVDWLNEQGYKVMVISKQPTKLKNVINKTGNFPIEHRMNEIKYCEFFLGIGSGLSWLAWALGKKVVMISGFSDPICEFKTNNINVHNFDVCNGCFNREMFDRGDWNWCPDHKDTDRQFECSINITPKMVTDRIIEAKLIEPVKEFDFNKNDIGINLKKEDVNIEYIKSENKINITHKKGKQPEMNIAIKNLEGETYHTISDISISNTYVVWTIPSTILHKKVNKIVISFYEKEPILDIILNI